MDNKINYHNIDFVDFSEIYKDELNTWQCIEEKNNQNGIKRFVGDENTNLGDYLEYVSTQMEIPTKMAIFKGEVVGFVCFTINNRVAHIEIMGTSPKHRKQGYSISILKSIKKLLQVSDDISKITLKVRKENIAALSAFSKIAMPNEKLSTENYMGYEL